MLKLRLMLLIAVILGSLSWSRFTLNVAAAVGGPNLNYVEPAPAVMTTRLTGDARALFQRINVETGSRSVKISSTAKRRELPSTLLLKVGESPRLTETTCLIRIGPTPE